MYILKQSPRTLGLDEPIRHESHKRPVSRRDFIAQGFMTGPGIVAAPSLLSLIMSNKAAALSPDLAALQAACGITNGAGKIPFICFDLAGGANMTGSEILAGTGFLPTNFLSTAGYAKLGLPGNMTPNSPNAASGTNNFINEEFGAAWHSDGGILRGMQASTQVGTRANVNGYPIAARSENDTGNNPHNPMYGINRIGADGQLLTLIGSQNTDSGGNSMAPASMMDPAVRPTKVDRASDVTGLVDTGELGTLFANTDDAVAVLESMTRLGHVKVGLSGTKLDGGLSVSPDDVALKELVRCGYIKSTYLADQFRDKAALNPDEDPFIVGQATSIFTQAEYDADNEFRKTAAVMKMVISGYAGAGTVTMGGYDYHGQGRNTAETRNFRAGRCIGAQGRARDDLCVQRRFSVGERRDQQHCVGPRQARLRQRQPVHGQSVRAGLQPRPPSGVSRRYPQADRFVQRQRRRAGQLEPGRQRGQPAGRDRAAELHGAAFGRGQLRPAGLFPAAWPGQLDGARPAHDVRTHLHQHHRQSDLSLRS
jgi:hypothetical protein